MMVLPTLAEKIGINEAILLQQIHYWLKTSGHEHDGKKWIYNTYEDWKKQLRWCSTSTIKRAVLELERKNLLIAGNFNKSYFNRH